MSNRLEQVLRRLRVPDGVSSALAPVRERWAGIAERLPWWFTGGVAIAVAVNVILLAAYLWSRGGQTTHVTVQALDSEFSAQIDSRTRVEAVYFDAPDEGAVTLYLEDTDLVPSLPKPRGIDRIEVSDARTDEMLFEDSFSTFDQNRWRVTRGEPIVRDGLLGTGEGDLIIETIDSDWSDVRVNVTYKNVTTGIVSVRVAGDTSVGYDFRPFRHLDGHLALTGDQPAAAGHPAIESSRSETIRSITAMALEPYPWLLVIIVGVVIVTFAAAFVDVPRTITDFRVPPLAAWVGVLALAAVLLGVTLRLNYGFASHMPHVPDETSYIFQAQVFASGNLWAEPPPVQDSFQLGNPPLIVEHDGRWASLYPFGHPLALAVGEIFGAMWIIPPLLCAASAVLIFAVGRNIYGARVGALAALLFALSPWVMMTASNYMSHNTAAFYMLCALFFLTLRPRATRRQLWYGVAAGAFFTMIFSTRQLTGIAFIPSFGVLLLAGLADGAQRALRLRHLLGFVAGATVILLVYFLYRWLLSGDPFEVDPAQAGEDQFGFGGAHSVAVGLANAQTLMAYLVLVLDNAPLATGLVLVCLPFVFGTRSRWDWAMLVGAVTLMGAYVWYYYHGLMHGPRFWYEAMPFFALLSARGIDRAAMLLSAFAAWLHARMLGRERAAPWAAAGVAYAFVLSLSILGTHNWLVGDGRGWDSDFVPSYAAAIKGFNGTDDRISRSLDRADIGEGLVLVDPCGQWWCYGSVVWRNSVSLDGDLVFANNIPERNAELFAHYPDKPVYVADYFASTLRPYDSQEVVTGPEDADDAPRAGDIPTPTPVPTPTPDIAAVQRRDAQRIRDLELVADLLSRYSDANGGFPMSGGVQTLCRYPNDAGCSLDSVGTVPADPNPDATYWYESNGLMYVVYAQMEDNPPDSPCPDPIPEHLSGVERLYCVSNAPPP